MNEAAVLDAAKLITAGGFSVFVAVELVKRWTGSTGRATLAAATVAGFGLSALYAYSNGLLVPSAAFDMVIAGFGLTAAGAGINAVASTMRDGGQSGGSG